MDRRTELLLEMKRRMTQSPPRWEDEEKLSNSVEELRAEFRRRLYDTPPKKDENETD